MPKPNDGAPFVSTTLPFLSRIFASAWSATFPAAASTFGSVRTRARSDCGTDGDCAMSPSKLMPAALPVTTASVPAYDSLKMLLNASSIASVSTSVPLIMATPRTIAIEVSAARSFRPARPRSATRITSD
jgi:hypothetical protein